MSALRPAMRRGLLRTSRRSYATPATPEPASAAQKAQHAAQESAHKAQQATQHGAQAAKEAGSNATAKASETGASIASKAQETGSNAMAKAQEAGEQALSKAKDAFAAAGPMASKLGESTANVVSKIPGGGGKVVSGVQSMIPHVTYYSKVGLELAKQVSHGQKMSPPSLQTFQQFYAPYYQPLLKPSAYTWILNPATYGQVAKQASSSLGALPAPTKAVEQVRGLSSKQWAEYAVLGAEFLGFFTVGTMIGRMKIVGYRGGAPAAHH